MKYILIQKQIFTNKVVIFLQSYDNQLIIQPPFEINQQLGSKTISAITDSNQKICVFRFIDTLAPMADSFDNIMKHVYDSNGLLWTS